MSTARHLPLLIAAMLAAGTLRAQHTFSIVAVDPETGQVGSAGASCVPFDAAIISDVHPGIGAIHTQASYIPQNQDHGVDLMDRHLPAQTIVDSLVAFDAEGNSGVRQYGVVTLAGDQKTAAYTGIGCSDYKGHITGPTYSIQGNILLGRQVLDSMEAQFLRQPGSLADKLMAALQGAKMIGADTRCAPYSSSHSAFLRVAQPTDQDQDHLWLNIDVSLGPDSQREPIDSLQTLFSRWQAGQSSVPKSPGAGALRLDLETIGDGNGMLARIGLPLASDVELALFDAMGREVRTVASGWFDGGTHDITFPTAGLADGTYFVRMTCAAGGITRKTVLTRHD
ncbi:MAG: DUF1028 domain-containing protein [Bacteroidetes bacterium]|nr:DUF1028 domain-containing protein [Bacteroidota bacterium]